MHGILFFPIKAADPCAVVSVRSASWDDTFERSLAAIGCQVHVLSVSDSAQAKAATNDGAALSSGKYWNQEIELYKRHCIALGAVEEGKVWTLKKALSSLGIRIRSLCVLKIDCNGCEWSSFIHHEEDFDTLNHTEQILLRFSVHDRRYSFAKFQCILSLLEESEFKTFWSFVRRTNKRVSALS